MISSLVTSYRSAIFCHALLTLFFVVSVSGCVSPQYTLRRTPIPDESAAALRIEQQISAQQAEELDAEGAWPLGSTEKRWGFATQDIVDRLSRVTERPHLHYRAYVWKLKEPNAAALADGRIYISTGMFNYLASRGSRADELAAIIGHELAHTVAQHLVKRYHLMQQQQLLIAVLATGTALATRNASSQSAAQTGRIVMDVADMLKDVANSGYSQEQELEADQLGIEYVIRAGFDPQATLELLQDFARFDSPSPFLRTHPYISLRQEYLARYLRDRNALGQTTTSVEHPPETAQFLEARRERLRKIQALYPKGSISWQNIQRQLDTLNQ